jgi:hypothetical protein
LNKSNGKGAQTETTTLSRLEMLLVDQMMAEEIKNVHKNKLKLFFKQFSEYFERRNRRNVGINE